MTPRPGESVYGPSGRSAWLDVDWREHLRWVRVDGRWVNVVDIGTGPVIVFLHGLAGCWQNWLETIPEFARDHRVIALDLPGFGESQIPASPISMPGYASMLDELFVTLGVDSATIVGSSMGGFVAAEFAIRYRAQVERLCLASPAGLSMEHMRNERNQGARARVENWLIPDARRIEYADTGHLVMLERPARFNDELRAFLQESPASPSPWSSSRAVTK